MFAPRNEDCGFSVNSPASICLYVDKPKSTHLNKHSTRDPNRVSFQIDSRKISLLGVRFCGNLVLDAVAIRMVPHVSFLLTGGVWIVTNLRDRVVWHYRNLYTHGLLFPHENFLLESFPFEGVATVGGEESARRGAEWTELAEALRRNGPLRYVQVSRREIF